MRWDISAHTDWITIEVWGETPSNLSEIEAIMQARSPITSVNRRDALILIDELLRIRTNFLSQYGADKAADENRAEIHQVK